MDSSKSTRKYGDGASARVKKGGNTVGIGREGEKNDLTTRLEEGNETLKTKLKRMQLKFEIKLAEVQEKKKLEVNKKFAAKQKDMRKELNKKLVETQENMKLESLNNSADSQVSGADDMFGAKLSQLTLDPAESSKREPPVFEEKIHQANSHDVGVNLLKVGTLSSCYVSRLQGTKLKLKLKLKEMDLKVNKLETDVKLHQNTCDYAKEKLYPKLYEPEKELVLQGELDYIKVLITKLEEGNETLEKEMKRVAELEKKVIDTQEKLHLEVENKLKETELKMKLELKKNSVEKQEHMRTEFDRELAKKQEEMKREFDMKLAKKQKDIQDKFEKKLSAKQENMQKEFEKLVETQANMKLESQKNLAASQVSAAEDINKFEKELNQLAVDLKESTKWQVLNLKEKINKEMDVKLIELMHNVKVLNDNQWITYGPNSSTTFDWIIKNYEENKSNKKTLLSESFYTNGHGYKLRCKANLGPPLYVEIELVKSEYGTLLPTEFYKSTFMIMDQMERVHKRNIIRSQENGFNSRKKGMWIGNIHSLFGSETNKMLQESRNKGVYLVDDALHLRVILEPLESLFEHFHSNNGTLLWKIPNYNRTKMESQQRIHPCYQSKYFYSAPVMGYRMKATLSFLNEKLFVHLRFLKGPNDITLFSISPHKVTFTIVNQKNTNREHLIQIGTTKADYHETYFFTSYVEVAPYLVDDSIVVMVNVEPLKKSPRHHLLSKFK